MREIKETCYKGTRILLGNGKRDMLNDMIQILKNKGFHEIQIPIIQHQDLFRNKVGEENNNLMFNFTDRGNRELCLAPEYTAVVQQLAHSTLKQVHDLKIFYVAECFRGEKPQAGRYRQFTQLGVEILNPKDHSIHLTRLAADLVEVVTNRYEVSFDVSRGLDYYEKGRGFEISCDELGSSKQVCGGGRYDGGEGFALGIDRLLNIYKNGVT